MPNSFDWNTVGYWIAIHIRAVAGTIGITGLGVAFVKFLRHAPAPKKSSIWAGFLFDTFHYLASNDSRIGERRDGAERVQVASTAFTE